MAEQDQKTALDSNKSDASQVSVLLVTSGDGVQAEVEDFVFSLIKDNLGAADISDVEFLNVPSESPLPKILKDTRKCCHDCGYRAVELSEKEVNGTRVPVCRECEVYDHLDHSENVNQFVVAWMPKRSKAAVSAMSKLLTMTSLATAEEQLIERYTAPDAAAFASAVDELLVNGKTAFPDALAVLKFISEHCKKAVKEITAEFELSIEAAKGVFGTNSLDEYRRLYSLSNVDAQGMMDTGVRLIPKSIAKNQTGAKQVAHFLRDITTALSVSQGEPKSDNLEVVNSGDTLHETVSDHSLPSENKVTTVNNEPETTLANATLAGDAKRAEGAQ
jgi:hypothetical protein